MRTILKVITSFILIKVSLIFIEGCNNTTIPRNIKAIENFKKDRYLGKWFEIARFDFRFEKDLNNTTAEYSLNSNGSIKVVNRGFNFKTKKWEEVSGKAKFVNNESVGMLKVSFFGPFYGGYNVIAIDPEYKYALVAGQSLDYLWILSREKNIPEDIKSAYLDKALNYGFDIGKLVWVEHNN
jgi:apolipoprotein D and lipocalin family protein